MKVDFLSKNFFIEEYQFRTPTFVKTFFDKLNFKNNLFLKSYPIFDQPSFINGI